MSWNEFEWDSPELAALDYQKLNRKIAYLATLKKDGSPRLHPVKPFIGNHRLFIFTEPSSPKIRDLRRNRCYALHSAMGGEGPLIEVLVSGDATEISDPVERTLAKSIAALPVVSDSYVMFEFKVYQMLVVEYDGDQQIVHRWEKGSGNLPKKIRSLSADNKPGKSN
jgi:hypothetical protein